MTNVPSLDVLSKTRSPVAFETSNRLAEVVGILQGFGSRRGLPFGATPGRST